MTKEEAIELLESEKNRFSYKFQPYDVETREKWQGAYDMAIKALKQEPKTGHWTERKIHETTGFFLPTCSECGRIQPYAHHTFSWNYCPNCGARMESEE